MTAISVTFKTLKQDSFKLELQPTETIADVKKKIATERGDEYAVELQKLIYNGKILVDEDTVEVSGLDPQKFVVVMLAAKKKTAEPAKVEATNATPVTKPPATQSTSGVTPTVAPAAEQATPQAPAPTPQVPNAPARGIAHFTSEQNSQIEAISSMGYPRDQVVAALQAAYWNADRAVEFLISGIPDEAQLGAGVYPSGGLEGEQEHGEGSETGEGMDDLSYLRNSPQINELRRLIQANPALLNDVFQQINAVNPELLNVIQARPNEFLQLLNEPVVEEGGAGEQAAGAQQARPGDEGAAGGQPPVRGHIVRLTPAEQEAIQRIKSMGFRVPDAVIVEAYLACDKNEEMAIQYILDTMQEFQED